MKNKFIIFIIVVIAILIAVILFLGFNNNSNNENKEESKVINCAKDLYDKEKTKIIEFNSQCLGTCEGYAVDIVHVPRSEEDNKIENQCADYRNGKLKSFIELDENGKLVRIAK